MALAAGSAQAQVMLIGSNKVIFDPSKDNAAPATIAVRAGRILAIKPGRVERGAFPRSANGRVSRLSTLATRPCCPV
ncbi:hypothetical protein [Hankyongella ginsenosidimutans]|uniref:hypothetical protein n=1 Tax=Hankyongella ginsenosidimutans TaxID=1763828 RepID=UPI001FE25B71|nr:hypothetical protein [Hankyongella ginsenosidimutans]